MTRHSALGTFLLIGYAIHAVVHISRHEPYDLLWACHIAALFVAFGLIFRNATLNAIGLLWSCVGIPLWIFDIATGGEFIPTSTLTHIGAFVLGIYGVRTLGMPRRATWKALAAYAVLWIVTRAITPRSANINLAFSIHPGWETTFGGYPQYLATLLAGGALTFALGENLFRRIA